MEKTVNDQELYERMAAPYSSRNEAERAMNGFFDEVCSLREKYRIPDVLVVCAATHNPDDRGVDVSCFMSSWGIPNISAELAATANEKYKTITQSIGTNSRRLDS